MIFSGRPIFVKVPEMFSGVSDFLRDVSSDRITRTMFKRFSVSHYMFRIIEVREILYNRSRIMLVYFHWLESVCSGYYIPVVSITIVLARNWGTTSAHFS